VINYNF